MTKFCKICDNLLVATFNNDDLYFKCMMCHISYDLEPEDTLRYEFIKESNVMIYEKILNRAVDDPVVYKTYKKCIDKKCKGELIKQMPVGEEMRLYNICTTCRTQWLN